MEKKFGGLGVPVFGILTYAFWYLGSGDMHMTKGWFGSC
jgi:hypothetical protein